MAETLTETPAAPAAPDEETFEVDLTDEAPEAPEDDLASGEAEGEETPPPTQAAAVEPAKAEKPKVTPPEPPPKPDVTSEALDDRPRERLHPAAREERAKRKEYARLYAETKEQLDAAEQQLRLLRTAPSAADDPNLKRWYDDLGAEADKAATMSEVLKLSIREMDRRDRARVQELNSQLYGIRCDLSETRARQRHPDWAPVIEQAGLFRAIATDAQGRFGDPVIARRIYYTADGGLAPDPAERMYRLAVGKLEYERAQRGEPEADEEGGEVTTQGAAVPKGKAEPKAEVAEAERRGAQRVIEQVSKNSTRPRGIRAVPKAEGPMRLTRPQLDQMLQENPAAYERLLQKHPDLERFHLGG